ncbi:hypothetical protein QJS10_CPB04g01366 [Acorus calamus]|uniref:Ribonuclease H1 N-terminal domain-containing protein n=1 Tax=Acorus calamus TaxID=4465 RepID=A0AAV9F0B8_ACOCL|nr:hypothetical protein QJS10_CPB04g01366 [Acorus calamus]
MARGRRPGLYSSWKECEAQVKGFSATYAGMHSIDDADRYFQEHGVGPLSAVENANTSDLHQAQEIKSKISPIWSEGERNMHDEEVDLFSALLLELQDPANHPAQNSFQIAKMPGLSLVQARPRSHA